MRPCMCVLGFPVVDGIIDIFFKVAAVTWSRKKRRRVLVDARQNPSRVDPFVLCAGCDRSSARIETFECQTAKNLEIHRKNINRAFLFPK